MLPNFLIVGVARCGTTSLYYYLMQHPEIMFPNVKEPKYFSSIKRQFPQNGIGDENIDRYIVRDYEKYESLFSSLSSKRIGEASPDYLYYSGYTAKSIKALLGDVPIIILIRNPIERAKSAYKYLVRENREDLSFCEAIMAEEDRLDRNWDFMWAYKTYGLYYSKIMDFKESFVNVKVIIYEEFVKDTKRILKDTFSFLGVNHGFEVDTRTIHNSSGKPNILGSLVLDRQSKFSTHLREMLKKSVPRNILEYVAGKTMSKINIGDVADCDLQSYYLEDVKKLSQVLDKDLGELWFGN